LVEYLPFETEPLTVIATIRLILQTGLIDSEAASAYSVSARTATLAISGFSTPRRRLAPALPARDDLRGYATGWPRSSNSFNTLAAFLAKLLDAPGQTFLAVSETQQQHPVDKYTVAALMDIIGNYRPRVAPGGAGGEIDAAQCTETLWLPRAMNSKPCWKACRS
jgi:hypothetical protein